MTRRILIVRVRLELTVFGSATERQHYPLVSFSVFTTSYWPGCSSAKWMGGGGEQIWLKNYKKKEFLNDLFCLFFSDVHFVSTLEPLSNAVKRNVPRCTITPVLLEQAHFRISVTCPSFVQTTLIRLLKDVSTQCSNDTISTRFYKK